MEEGRVESIFLAPARGETPVPVERVRALARQGRQGDRYFAPEGHAEPD